jgi:uncharacterized membrane protein YdbT with pleckstrin-like domain
MARYIDEILQPGEKLLYSTTIHWIFYAPGVLAWIVAIVCWILQRRAESQGAGVFWLAIAVVAALIAVYWSFRAWFHRWTTETDVTSLRVVHKEGFIKRRTFEMNLDKVESVDVDQTILGRLLGYGDVTINGVGEGRETIRTIAHPLQFRNHITARPL